jgi:hypothetical protein
MTVIQLQIRMSEGNDKRVPQPYRAAGVRLEMSPQSFGVLSVADPVLIRCLKGWAWITQEANRNDTVLDANQECQLAGSQKVFINASDGALLAIADARDGSGPPRLPCKWKNLRIEITRGAYALSGTAFSNAGRMD